MEERGVAGDGSGKKESARLERAVCLAEGLDAVRPVGEVIERAEEEYCVDGFAFARECAGIALADSGKAEMRCLFEVFVNGVEEVDGVAEGGEPCGVGSGAPADVEDSEGRLPKAALDDLLSAMEFEQAGAAFETGGFVGLSVVGVDFAHSYITVTASDAGAVTGTIVRQ